MGLNVNKEITTFLFQKYPSTSYAIVAFWCYLQVIDGYFMYKNVEDVTELILKNGSSFTLYVDIHT